MGKMVFDSAGRPMKPEFFENLKLDDFTVKGKNDRKNKNANFPDFKIEVVSGSKEALKTSDNLEFLKEDSSAGSDKSVGDIFTRDYWSLYSNDVPLTPLRFTNGKTQEDVVREVVELTKEGHKVIFIHGTCGSGKSAIALNIARALGKSSIVVPVKTLQKQYEEDYIGKKYLRKKDGKKMRIAMITGRDNHDSIINPGASCADPNLPENIKLVEKNQRQILEYARQNPFIDHPENITFENVRRFTIAVANPYWSPILPANFDFKALTDAKKIRYLGVNGQDHIFYHRKKGCSYYDQYLAYMDSDVTIFNSAKYKAEMSLGRKPLTEVDIIDEADEFLDEFFQQDELNLSRLLASARGFYPESDQAQKSLQKIMKLIELEEQNKRATGVKEDFVFQVSETKIKELLQEFNASLDLESEITLDELNYLNKGVETARTFEHSLDSLYLTYRKNEEGNLLIKLVSTDISGKFQDLMNKTKSLVFMSGTLHSETIIKNIFQIADFKIVQAESLNFGSMTVVSTGFEFDCKYSNFSTSKHSREDYLRALSACIGKAQTPVLVHVHAFKDLPTEEEIERLGLVGLRSSERLKSEQTEDKEGRAIILFKKGMSSYLFTTKCSRGIDFPGEMCNSIVFTKYPNPNVSDTFWKVLQKTHPSYYWEFYKDKASRGFLQRIYRALRSPTDHVKVLSPDIRVLESAKMLQDKNAEQRI